MKKLYPDKILIGVIFLLIGTGVAHNYKEQYSVDRSKIPDKVETSKNFQRWITNVKNKGLDQVNADDFRLIEENEIYNSKWMKVYSTDEEGRMAEFENNVKAHQNIRKVVFSPSERIYIDYRNEDRDGYKPNEIHFYGVRDDKIIDARILDCSPKANCYFDRAYFLSNDVFVVTEFSRNINKKDPSAPLCAAAADCTYTIKLHLIDLINNSRLVYESKPFNIILTEMIPEL